MKRHYFLKMAATAIVVVFNTLLLLEIAARLWDGRDLLTLRNWVTEALESRTETHSARFDPQLGWSGKPNLNINGIKLKNPNIPNMSHVVVTTNDKGYRSSGSLSIASSGKKSIMTIGDSFTWGSEVSDHETYPAHLQKILQIPVVNLAYGGWGTDQMWLRMQAAVEGASPSLFILSPLTHDVLRNAYRRHGRAFKPYFDLVDGVLMLRNSPVPRNSTKHEDIGRFQSWIGRFYLATFVARVLGHQETWINRNLLNDRVHSDKKAVEIACALLVEAVKFSKRKKVPVVLVPIYGGQEVIRGERYWFTKRYIDCAAAANMPLIDTFDEFVKASLTEPEFPASRYRVWKNGAIAHMNSRGNRLVAQILARELRRRRYLD